MSITQITERETALTQANADLVLANRDCVAWFDALKVDHDALLALIKRVHDARGRYHSQLAMAALYEAAGLPCVKPISGVAS